MASKDEIREAAEAMMSCMFAAHELPLDDELRAKYYDTAQCALEVAERVRKRKK